MTLQPSLQPLLEASWIIQVHAFTAMAAFFLGLFQIVAPKGTLPHKTLGAIWVALMTTITVSSIFVIPSQRGFDLPIWQWFSPIHIFTIITAYGIFGGLYHLSRGGEKLKRHKGPFIGIFIGGILIAGGFAFMPGRIMHAAVFGPNG